MWVTGSGMRSGPLASHGVHRRAREGPAGPQAGISLARAGMVPGPWAGPAPSLLQAGNQVTETVKEFSGCGRLVGPKNPGPRPMSQHQVTTRNRQFSLIYPRPKTNETFLRWKNYSLNTGCPKNNAKLEIAVTQPILVA